MLKYTLFLSILFFADCNSNHTKIIEKWKNGDKKVVLTCDLPDDTLTYLREYYYENGKLGTKGNYLHNKRDGLWQWWYNNGNRKDEATLKEGIYIGERKHWREDGTLREVEVINGQCEDECCNGRVIYYDDKGIKLIEYSQQNEVWNGEGIAYFPDGGIKRKFNYVNGKKQGVNYEYFPNGKIEVEGNFIDDKEEGKWTVRDSTGEIKRYDYYKNGELITKR